MDKKKIETVGGLSLDIRPDMHGLYRYARQVIINQVPIDKGREFLLEMNSYSQRLLGECQEHGLVRKDNEHRNETRWE